MKLVNYNNSNDLKKMSEKDTIELINEIRTTITNIVYQNGGHLASNLAVVPLVIKILQVFDIYQNDIILFDTGHQTYCYKILTDRKEKFSSIRLYGGLEAFQNIFESKFDYLSNGHAGTALSIAMGYSFNPNNRVICIIGDGAFTNGLTLQALAHLATISNKITIILNDNNVSISENISVLNIHNIANLPKRTIKDLINGFNLNYLGPIDGENLNDLKQALSQSISYDNSVVIHVKTFKDPSLHSYSLINSATKLEWSQLVANKIKDLFHQEKFYFISPAMGSAIHLTDMFQHFPDFFIDVGIAEEHAALLSCGMIQDHKKVIVDFYSTFFQRIYDQLVHDVIRNKLPIIFLLDRAGLASGDGISHHGIYDLAMLYPFFNKTIIAQPACEEDLNQLLSLAFVNNDVPFFIRYPRYGNYQLVHGNKHFQIGEWEYLINDPENLNVIITYGNNVGEFYQFITNNNLKYNLVNARFIDPLDSIMLEQIIDNNYHNIIIYEETTKFGGLYDRIAKTLSASMMTNFLHYGYDENYEIPNWRQLLIQLNSN